LERGGRGRRPCLHIPNAIPDATDTDSATVWAERVLLAVGIG
jgi:hypothetical protein